MLTSVENNNEDDTEYLPPYILDEGDEAYWARVGGQKQRASLTQEQDGLRSLMLAHEVTVAGLEHEVKEERVPYQRQVVKAMAMFMGHNCSDEHHAKIYPRFKKRLGNMWKHGAPQRLLKGEWMNGFSKYLKTVDFAYSVPEGKIDPDGVDLLLSTDAESTKILDDLLATAREIQNRVFNMSVAEFGRNF